MIKLSRRTAVTMLPMFLVGGLFLSACSSGGDGASGNTSSSGSPAPIVAQLVQQGYLKASNATADDLFGFNVALSGDTLVVGAPQESSNAIGVNGNQADNSAPNSGAVYVFTRTNGVWNQQAYLKASNTDAGDQFGVIMALSDDTLAVGAQFEASNATGVNGDQTDNSAPQAGAVYVFTRTAGVWTQQAYLKASNAGGLFGYGLALAGDTLAVGGPFEGSNATGINGDQSDNRSHTE